MKNAPRKGQFCGKKIKVPGRTLCEQHHAASMRKTTSDKSIEQEPLLSVVVEPAPESSSVKLLSSEELGKMNRAELQSLAATYGIKGNLSNVDIIKDIDLINKKQGYLIPSEHIKKDHDEESWFRKHRGKVASGSLTSLLALAFLIWMLSQ